MTKATLLEKISKSVSKSTKTEVSKKQVDAILKETFETIRKTVKKEGRCS